MKTLLSLAESEAERERLRFAIVKGSGMSDEKARSIYGFHDMDKRSEKIIDAAEEAQAITECMLKVVHLKDKALLRSFGVEDDSVSEESESESETDTEESSSTAGRTVFDEEKNTQPCSKNIDDSMKGRTGFPHEENSMLPHQFQLSDCFNSDETYKHVTETQGVYMNSHQLLDILRNCDLNWFGFVEVIQDMLRLRNIYTDEAFQQLLLDFGGQLSFLGLSIEDERIVQQSRQAYLLSEREQIYRNQDTGEEIVSESDSSDTEMLQGEDILGDRGRYILKKKRVALRRKGIREAKQRIAERRFQKRHRSKRVSQVLQECPGIGKAIEDYVKECGAGADAWRRTGALTFDGNRKLKKNIQEDKGTLGT
ncbi:hypothetical protein QZH41_000350 [Actinostola sp. cb2023]|nr:hypothetical protein QZH41_000350 [Actinostola sp. cb2023]